ncbi:uncharacterized protein LOC135389574 [Ornithodoros turicata]|uniref:uncharacterized protein LOC135389574 n=1 Tax=Ornithodoros turicata TaxID=34597 RepID=UPI003138620B
MQQTVIALVVEQICAQNLEAPITVLHEEMQEHGLVMADSSTAINGEQVAILIGADYYWDFATGRTHKLQNGVQAAETTLGWTLQGPYAHTSALHSTTCNNITVLRVNTLSKGEMTKMMDQIWTLEGAGIQEHETEKTHPVMENFEQTIEYKGGRYVVSLPWKDEVSMEDNKGIALRRLSQVTRRLMKSSESMTNYDTVIREYIESGVAERVIESTGTANKTGHTYYMPHHAVVKEDRITTKIRIVFDASAHEAFTKSLNGNLHAGPNLNPDIMTAILNFRLYPVALISDVQKAFLQILIREEDRDALGLLWYETTPRQGEPMPRTETWRMNRVTFGTAPSTFLLAATLQHHLRRNERDYPEIVKALLGSIYVDDVVLGAVNLEEARRRCNETRQIFSKASMKLQKLGSNSSEMRAVRYRHVN